MPRDTAVRTATAMKRDRNGNVTKFSTLISGKWLRLIAKNSPELQRPFTDVVLSSMALGRIAQRLRVA
jgi:hypothetical protein